MKRVLADTNVLVAALVWPHGVGADALLKILSQERLVLTEYILDEFHEVISRKFEA